MKPHGASGWHVAVSIMTTLMPPKMSAQHWPPPVPGTLRRALRFRKVFGIFAPPQPERVYEAASASPAGAVFHLADA